MVERLQLELERKAEEEKERKERRRKNVYNEKWAEKTCWGCGIKGHLVYWCPELMD